MSSNQETQGQLGGTSPSVKRRGQPRCQVVDPAVSRAKFDREVGALRRHEDDYRRQGWFVLRAEFPEALLVLTVPQLRPAPVLFGVTINFTNYDVDPLSIRLINPWTGELLRARELLSPLPRLVQPPPTPPRSDSRAEEPAVAEADSSTSGSNEVQAEPTGVQAQERPNARPWGQAGRLMQWWTDDSLPFVCMRGVREYHRHPAHTGDAWLLHRGRGEGTLAAILSAIHDHGVAPIRDYVYAFSVQAQPADHNGFVQKVTARINGLLNVLPDGSVHPWLLA